MVPAHHVGREYEPEASQQVRFDLRPRINGLHLVLLAAVISLANVFRVSLALHLDSRGVSWGLAHTVPDALIHLVPLTIFVLLALCRDMGDT